MTLKVQYCSDSHLEFKSSDIVPKLLKNINADVLILAGDICAINTPEDYDKFIALLTHYCPKYKHILHVAGNHEYYTTTTPVNKSDCMDAVNRKFKSLKKTFPNYTYLNCDAVTLQINNKSYMFIGATLWTKIQNVDWSYVENRMNDYSCIYLNRGDQIIKWNVEDMQKLHAKHKIFIKKAIDHAASLNIPTILITHHKPLEDTTEYDKNKLTQAYETEIRPLLKSPVKLCIWGHTHTHYLKKINGIIYTSNPIGYKFQHCGFKTDLGITI